MEKKPPAAELTNDKEYWQSTVGKVDSVLPTSYAKEVKALLKKWGETDVSDEEIYNVRRGRTYSKRVIAKAIYEIGARHLKKEEVPA